MLSGFLRVKRMGLLYSNSLVHSLLSTSNFLISDLHWPNPKVSQRAGEQGCDPHLLGREQGGEV